MSCNTFKCEKLLGHWKSDFLILPLHKVSIFLSLTKCLIWFSNEKKLGIVWVKVFTPLGKKSSHSFQKQIFQDKKSIFSLIPDIWIPYFVETHGLGSIWWHFLLNCFIENWYLLWPPFPPLQSFLVWQLILSYIFLGRRYRFNQLLGCLLVAVGVIVTVAR